MRLQMIFRILAALLFIPNIAFSQTFTDDFYNHCLGNHTEIQSKGFLFVTDSISTLDQFPYNPETTVLGERPFIWLNGKSLGNLVDFKFDVIRKECLFVVEKVELANLVDGELFLVAEEKPIFESGFE